MENEFLISAKNHALKYPNEEVCGLVISDGNQLKYFPCNNISSKRNKNFEIDPACYLKAKKAGLIEGCFHSHYKGGSFSFIDINNSFKNNIKYYLYSVKKNKFYIFDPKEKENYRKYINRNYVNGELS